MPQTIKGKVPVTLKVAFEVRYRQGYTYLDRCGRTINLIQEYHPEWIIAGSQPNPQSGTMLNVERGTKLSFSSHKFDMGIDRPTLAGDLDQEKIEQFATDAEELSSIVFDQLGLADFSRIGCRVWFLFPADSEVESWKFLDSLNLYSVSPALIAAFGERESATFSMTATGQDRKFKVSCEFVERTIEVDVGEAVVNVPVQALPSHERRKALLKKLEAKSRKEKHPPFATSIDIDAYREDPEILKPAEFVLSSIKMASEGLRAAIEKAIQ
jgi:hypothetical protein